MSAVWLLLAGRISQTGMPASAKALIKRLIPSPLTVICTHPRTPESVGIFMSSPPFLYILYCG